MLIAGNRPAPRVLPTVALLLMMLAISPNFALADGFAIPSFGSRVVVNDTRSGQIAEDEFDDMSPVNYWHLTASVPITGNQCSDVYASDCDSYASLDLRVRIPTRTILTVGARFSAIRR